MLFKIKTIETAITVLRRIIISCVKHQKRCASNFCVWFEVQQTTFSQQYAHTALSLRSTNLKTCLFATLEIISNLILTSRLQTSCLTSRLKKE